MVKKRQRISYTQCRRCGTTIASSIWSMTHPLGRICGKCITPGEKEEILQYQSGVILKKGRRNIMVTKTKETATDVFARHFIEGMEQVESGKGVRLSDEFHRRAYRYGDPFNIPKKERDRLFKKGIVV